MKLLLRMGAYGAGGVVLLPLIGTAVFWRSDLPDDYLQKKYSNAASRFVNISGMPVHYRDEGNLADSTPLVLLHGTASSLHTWDSVTGNLKKQHRIIRLDLPGFGLTGPMHNNRYDADTYADFLKTFFDSLHIKSCYLAGNSLGGYIAWRFALAYPTVVKKLVLVGAGGMPVSNPYLPPSFRIAKMPVAGNLLQYVAPRSLVAKSVRKFYADPSKVTEALVTRYHELSLRRGNRSAMIRRVRQLRGDDAYQELRLLTVPALILWGEKDKMYPLEAAYRFSQLLPNDTLVVLKNTGHLPMEEAPAATTTCLLNFLK